MSILGYLFSKYVQIAVLIATPLTAVYFMLGVPSPLLRAVFWSGLLAAFATYKFFSWQNLWVLYRNLRYPPWLALTLSAFLFEVIALTIVILMR